MTERLLEHILSTLPGCDLEDYPRELFESFARHGAMLRRERDWCGELSEEMFLTWVLCPRVNNEELSDCRGVFYRELEPRVRGLGLYEAILEVNRWCAEQVTYRSTDIRTASALAVYESGYGRCGEESMFAVNALRSVGIAARQVYAPWWSHCDDNHAWVEAFDGREWRFLGACEPEPRLDMGWFVPAAGRAMLCHTKAFVGEGDGWERLVPGAEPMDIRRREGVAYLSVTHRYAKVRDFEVLVRDPEGRGVEGAAAEFYVLNEGLLRQIAARVTDKSGRAAIRLGLGSVWIAARKGGMAGETLADTGETGRAELRLGGARPMSGPYDFRAPEDSGVRTGGLSGEEKLCRQRERAYERELRERRHPIGGPGPRKPELWPWERFPPDKIPELWRDGRAHGDRGPKGCGLTLREGDGRGALGLMRWREGWEALRTPRFGKEWPLEEGRYRLITAYRLPGGGQLAEFRDFSLENGESLELTVNFRKGRPEELLQRLPLPDVGFSWQGLGLLCWIEPGAEPTEHLLGELRERGGFPCPVHFICRGPEPGVLPEGAQLHPWDGYAAEAVARRMFLEPDNLPLMVLADREGYGRYASAGYNVGSVELAAELCGLLPRS